MWLHHPGNPGIRATFNDDNFCKSLCSTALLLLMHNNYAHPHARYTGDTCALETRLRLKGKLKVRPRWLGDDYNQNGIIYLLLSQTCDPSNPLGVNLCDKNQKSPQCDPYLTFKHPFVCFFNFLDRILEMAVKCHRSCMHCVPFFPYEWVTHLHKQ